MTVDAKCTFCLEDVETQVIRTKPHDNLLESDIELLWELFCAIGEAWKIDGAERIRSSWKEFIHVKMKSDKILPELYPDYTGEYKNAAAVILELKTIHGADAFRKLFFEYSPADGQDNTRIAHAKKYVVDEFIRVFVDAGGGFKSFLVEPDRMRANYRGYVGGSRYNRISRVRTSES